MLNKKYNFLLLKRRDILNLHFKSVNKNNRKQIELLSVAKNQAGFVESVTECLEDAKNDKSYEPVGIYDGNTLIGFAMYGLFTDTTPSGEVWLDRLLIDEHFQSKGYGKNAILKLLKMLKDKYKRKEVYLSVYDNNVNAIKLYKKIGFKFNGKLDINGEKIMTYEF